MEEIEQGSGSLAPDRMIEHLRDATGLFERAVAEQRESRRLAHVEDRHDHRAAS